jgi:hypothetical protein
MRKYPEYAVKRMEEEYERLDRSFSRLWGALSPSHERDEILLHVINAKTLLYKLIKESREEQ